MSIQSIFKSTVVALTIAASGSLFAQGTPINAAAYDALVAQGPVADAATIASSTWASKIKQAGTLRLGSTQTSNLFSLLNEKDGKIRGFDLGLAQLITRYILGDAAKYQFTQVTSSTREQVLINNQVDMVFATYSITPARAEKISFAGPYYTSQSGVLVKSNNKTLQSYNDLGGKKVVRKPAPGACDTGSVRPQGRRAGVPDASGSPRCPSSGPRRCLCDRLHAAAQRPEPWHQQCAAGWGSIRCPGPLWRGTAQGLGRRGLHQCLSQEAGSRRYLGQALDYFHWAAHRQHDSSDSARSALNNG